MVQKHHVQLNIVFKIVLLCINLLLLLDLIPNNLAMANVSFVPVSYIFLRGQGVKITSVVSRKCSSRNTRIMILSVFS